MGNFSVQNNSRVNNTAPQVVYDAGESLKSAIQSVLTNDTNGHISSTVSQLEATLRQNGIRNTRFVGQLLYSFRGVQQGVPGDLQKFKQAVQMARSAGALGPRGATSLLGMVGEAAQKQADQARVDNSMLNVKNRPTQRKPFEDVFDSMLPKPPRLLGADIFQKTPPRKPQPQASVQARQTQQPKPAKQTGGDVSPAFERAINGIDAAAKSMPEGLLKSGLEAVHSSLELVKDAQELGDQEKHTRAIADLSSKLFALVGDLVKTFGQDPKLAGQAASQLGKISSALGGKIVGPIKVLDNASRFFAGKTLDGAPVNENKQAEALYDLISSPMPPPVQAAMAVSKMELEALYTYVGAPVQRAFESFGLKGLLGGKSPEQMKASIQALPTDAANANATVRKLLNLFPEGTRAFGQSKSTAQGLWRTYMSVAMKPDSEPLRAMISQDPKKPNTVPDLLREVVAERMKDAALKFVDEQVSEARGKW